jgi:cell fate regulator YaaT (PSP1 superfamily)
MDQPYIIGIRFQKSGKVYHFDASHSRDLQTHDFVVVETSRGRQLGEVIGIVTNPKPQDGNLKPIQRKATPRDLVLRQIWQCKEAEAIITCRSKAKELGFADLKFIEAEFSYDGTRLTLMYSSDEGGEKPDLRNIRRAMSRVYPHAQIEMHPLGPRDVAKQLGGMGACGLEERCCTGFLTDFSPISIKMAKEQGISLTPTEITGMCGRLRCCLAYEYTQYTEARISLPKRNKRVLTPQGEGKVVDVFPLKGSVLVLLINDVLHEYPAHEIQLFDDNGVPLPRPAVTEEEMEEQRAYVPEDIQAEAFEFVEEDLPEIVTPVLPTNPPQPQIPPREQTYRRDPRRGQRQEPRGQKPAPKGNPPSEPRKPKPQSRPGSKPSDKSPKTGNRPPKGKPPSNQRRNRGREQ